MEGGGRVHRAGSAAPVSVLVPRLLHTTSRWSCRPGIVQRGTCSYRGAGHAPLARRIPRGSGSNVT